MGNVHSIETFGTVDGPGIRFVVFLQGCPMRCLYCHNPDTWNVNGGKKMSAKNLLKQILNYKNYFGENGGVTVSGGEPLVQIDFVIELFKLLKTNNINTCLDTSGILFNSSQEMNEKIDELLKYTDLVLLDIKHINSNVHKTLTGFGNENVLAFANYLNHKKIPMWVRYVLLPNYTTDNLSLTNLNKFLKTLKNVQKIEVLPYHTMGVKKYEELGIEYKLNGVKPPTEQEITNAKKLLNVEDFK